MRTFLCQPPDKKSWHCTSSVLFQHSGNSSLLPRGCLDSPLNSLQHSSFFNFQHLSIGSAFTHSFLISRVILETTVHCCLATFPSSTPCSLLSLWDWTFCIGCTWSVYTFLCCYVTLCSSLFLKYVFIGLSIIVIISVPFTYVSISGGWILVYHSSQEHRKGLSSVSSLSLVLCSAIWHSLAFLLKDEIIILGSSCGERFQKFTHLRVSWASNKKHSLHTLRGAVAKTPTRPASFNCSENWGPSGWSRVGMSH